jgi:ribosomal protein S18 acetylase RimI-like enzyme
LSILDAVDGLDNVVWSSLTGPHAHIAEIGGAAARYPADVAVFAALADESDPDAWADLARLVGPGGSAALLGDPVPPPDWDVTWRMTAVRMVDTDLRAEPDPAALPLTAADVPEMLDLVRRTDPGPFGHRTIELGDYIGIRRDGALVAMAGERLRPPGWTEISAVCTDPAYRGQGMATRLVRAVAAGIRRRGDTPFLHTAASNTTAIRLYESIGFTLAHKVEIIVAAAPPS